MVVNAWLRSPLYRLALRNRGSSVTVPRRAQNFKTSANSIPNPFSTEEASLPEISLESTDHTVFSLRSRLVEISAENDRQKTEADFAFVNQNDVDNWNSFMRLSNEYHNIGRTERQTLIRYMGDVKTEYSRCVKGKDPRPESNAASWEEFWEKCAELAESWWIALKTVAKLRFEALKSPSVASGIERGLFTVESWDNHVEQITDRNRSMLELSQLLLDIHMYSSVWKAERERYAKDPEKYRLRGIEDDYIVHIMGYQDERLLHERKMKLNPVYRRAMTARYEAEERRLLAAATIANDLQHHRATNTDSHKRFAESSKKNGKVTWKPSLQKSQKSRQSSEGSFSADPSAFNDLLSSVRPSNGVSRSRSQLLFSFSQADRTSRTSVRGG